MDDTFKYFDDCAELYIYNNEIAEIYIKNGISAEIEIDDKIKAIASNKYDGDTNKVLEEIIKHFDYSYLIDALATAIKEEIEKEYQEI